MSYLSLIHISRGLIWGFYGGFGELSVVYVLRYILWGPYVCMRIKASMDLLGMCMTLWVYVAHLVSWMPLPIDSRSSDLLKYPACSILKAPLYRKDNWLTGHWKQITQNKPLPMNATSKINWRSRRRGRITGSQSWLAIVKKLWVTVFLFFPLPPRKSHSTALLGNVLGNIYEEKVSQEESR